MTDLATGLRELLDDGHPGVYSGAAAAVSIPALGIVTAVAGTHAYGDEKPVSDDSLFDLASVTKSIAAAAIVSVVEDGLLDPDEPMASRLAVGTGPHSESITLRHLLTHTSGLPHDVFVWREAGLSPEERLAIALRTPIESAPGEAFRYSCFGYIAAGKLAEAVTGKSLAELIAERVTVPLGLTTMRFGPVPSENALATEDESYIGRGMVRGEVHDELAWSLGGRVANAGLFATATDLLAFARVFDGTARGPRVLGEEGLRLMTTSSLSPRHGAGFGQGMGLRIADADFMGTVRGLGHTGFTGTMFVSDPARGTAAVLLTNRVHPSRDRVGLAELRTRFSELAASAAG